MLWAQALKSDNNNKRQLLMPALGGEKERYMFSAYHLVVFFIFKIYSKGPKLDERLKGQYVKLAFVNEENNILFLHSIKMNTIFFIWG